MNDHNDTPMIPENDGMPIPAEGQPLSYYAPVQKAKAEPFRADFKDAILAIFAYILGYFFSRWVLVSIQGWGVAVFTAVYLTSVLLYFIKKGIQPGVASWFWFAVTLLTGLSFALWADVGLGPLRTLFLFCSAVYWVITTASVQVACKTSNYLFLDGLNALFVIPFSNFINQYKAFAWLKGTRKRDTKKLFSVILGIIFALIALLIVTPQLLAADSGAFSGLIDDFIELFSLDWVKVGEFLMYCFLAVPVSAYLFGLVSGSAHKRKTGVFTTEKADKTVSSMRIMPSATAFIVLGAVCTLYILFIACQIPYFFSAFSGSRPDGWLSYSEYARQGFFELCGLAAFNLAMLTAANILSKKPRTENPALKVFNILLSLITLLLISTAMSKMVLYIDAFGLTILRILPSVFMLFMAIIFVAVIVMQKATFSIVRVSLVAGAVLFTALCLVNVDGLVVRYNTNRYLTGTLSGYDTTLLYRSGSAGVVPAIEAYEFTTDDALKGNIYDYLTTQNYRLESVAGTYRDTVQSAQARNAIENWAENNGISF